MIISFFVAALAAAASMPPPSSGAMPACSASQLSLSFDDENGNFSGMSHSGTLLVVRNIGASACSVPGLPELQFEDAARRTLPIVRQIPKGMHPGPVVLPARIAPGAEATAELRWISGDVYDGHHCVATAAAAVRIGADTLGHPLVGHFCSPANAPATFTQTWLKTDPQL